jgi:hypothetical protein
MGNDINSWRSSIGLFNGRNVISNGQYKLVISLRDLLHIFMNLFYSMHHFTEKCCIVIQNEVKSMHFCIILVLLLLQSGDIEENPGPENQSQHCLSILHSNIRSIRHKMEFIQNNFSDFDIICFTETHLDAAIPDEHLAISNTLNSFYRKDRTCHGGGILVYVSSNIVHERVIDLECFCNESIWIKIKVKGNFYLIGTFYSPKTSDPEFFSNFNKNIDKALEFSNNIIILGDLNDNLLDPNSRKLKDTLLLNSMINIVNEPTRVNALLDPIIIPFDMSYCEAGTISVPNDISDHRATYITLPFPYQLNNCYERTIFVYKNADFEKLNEAIVSIDWQCLYNGTVSDACKVFTTTFIEHVKSCIPTKKILIRPDDKPWFDSELRKFCRKRDRFKHLAVKTGKTVDFLKYKTARNKVNNMKKHAKETFFASLETNLEELHLNNKRGFWNIIRYFVKQNDCSNNIPPLIRQLSNGETELFTSDHDKANCLNDYFASISSVNDDNADLPQFSLKTQQNLSRITITEGEIEDVIKSLEINKACGPDLISHRMLKGVSATITKPLSILFNRSLDEEYFPDSWKLSHVTPIFKKGEKDNPTNYRPVSLLSCCGKIFERIIFKYMYNFFNDNNLLYKYQSGFLPNHSTTFQLIDIYHHICQSFDNKQYSCMVFCDISKAFDRVWHRGLLFKLQQNGINGKLLNWISNYLSDRKQKVTLKSTISTPKCITAGVPQGSVLGPLLFLIYVNDISNSLLSLTRLFADDSSLYCSASSLNDIEGMLNHDLHLISNWAKTWLVNFNPQKTEAVLFSLRHSNIVPNLSFENTVVNFVDSHKHLGVTLSSNGKWINHIDAILASASKTVSIMKKMKFILTRRALNQIYISYVRPILEYSCILWDGCSDQCSDKIEKLQNEAARVVTGLTKSVSLENLYMECGWEHLADRRNFQKNCFMYKCYHGMVPSYISELIPPLIRDTNRYPLRNSENINIPYNRTLISQQSCIPSSINAWNNLDTETRTSSTLGSFKSSLRKTFSKQNPPAHFYIGNRYLQILHARLRNNCSNLNYDLYNNHLRESPFCSCSNVIENAYHYFFECRNLINQRHDLFEAIRMYHPLNIDILLHGSNDLNVDDNTAVVIAVQNYIKHTKRFDTNYNNY